MVSGVSKRKHLDQAQAISGFDGLTFLSVNYSVGTGCAVGEQPARVSDKIKQADHEPVAEVINLIAKAIKANAGISAIDAESVAVNHVVHIVSVRDCIFKEEVKSPNSVMKFVSTLLSSLTGKNI